MHGDEVDRMFRCMAMLVFGLVSHAALADQFDHRPWDQLLQRHVTPIRNGQATVVDYDGFARDKPRLDSYLHAMSATTEAEFDQWLQHEQLAFLINAYNAWTIHLVLTGYPDIDSIKDLGNILRSPWEKKFIPLFGKTLSLDDIEHGLMRNSGRHRDPRIHFAVNCASIGCPALRPEAYLGDRLDAQLQEQQLLFLADRTRNRLEGDTLKVSPVFRWYRQDFEWGWSGIESLLEFFTRYADPLGLSDEHIRRLERGRINIGYLDYDWRLNAGKD